MTNVLFMRALAEVPSAGPVSVRIIGCRPEWALHHAGQLRDAGARAVTHDPTGAELRRDLEAGQ